ncbi:MAG: sugar transferase, partial [Patescibacteria group bacterium]
MLYGVKKTELIFNLISIPVDAVSLLLAGIASFYLRQKTTTIVGPIIYQLDVNNFLSVVYKIIAFLILIFAFLGLYNLKGTRKFISESGKIIIGVSLGLLVVILLFFFNQNIFPSRFIILATWGLGIFLVICGRLVLKLLQTLLFSKNIGLHKLVIITGGIELPTIESVYKNKNNGYEIIAELPLNGNLFDELEQLYLNGQIDEILQTNTGLNDANNLKLVQFARGKGLKFSFVPNLFEVQRNIIETENLNGLPVISLKNTPLDGWGKVSKRVLDLLVSAVCLFLTSPLFFIIALAVRVDSKGKVIYSALRGGRGKDFQFYKFRSMYSHLSIGHDFGGEQAEKIKQELWHTNDRGGENGPLLKIKDD